MKRAEFPLPELPGLRPWRLADAAALAAAWADPDIVANCGVPDDAGLDRAERWIAGWEDRRVAGTALDLVAVTPDDEVAGEVGLVPRRDAVELGWWVLPAHRGRGLARAMVTDVVVWATDALAGRPIVARIPPGHNASERVAASAGLVRVGPMDDSHDLWRGTGPGWREPADRVRA